MRLGITDTEVGVQRLREAHPVCWLDLPLSAPAPGRDPMRMVSIRFIGTSANSGGDMASTISPSASLGVRHLPLNGCAFKAVHWRTSGALFGEERASRLEMPPRNWIAGRLVIGDSHNTSSKPCGVHDSTWPETG